MFVLCLRIVCGCFAENCGDVAETVTSPCKRCGDSRRRRICAKAARKVPESWLVKLPRLTLLFQTTIQQYRQSTN